MPTLRGDAVRGAPARRGVGSRSELVDRSAFGAGVAWRRGFYHAFRSLSGSSRRRSGEVGDRSRRRHFEIRRRKAVGRPSRRASRNGSPRAPAAATGCRDCCRDCCRIGVRAGKRLRRSGKAETHRLPFLDRRPRPGRRNGIPGPNQREGPGIASQHTLAAESEVRVDCAPVSRGAVRRSPPPSPVVSGSPDIPHARAGVESAAAEAAGPCPVRGYRAVAASAQTQASARSRKTSGSACHSGKPRFRSSVR